MELSVRSCRGTFFCIRETKTFSNISLDLRNILFPQQMFPLVRVEETMLTRFLGPASSLNIHKCLGTSLSAFF